MSLALALKYRPQLFCDLIGQDAISKTLGMALDKNRIVHAYLFSGLRGSGKTSSARIFARALECERGPISTPCGECDICKATLEGRNIDIIEMDAASNRSIDNIRDLIEQTKYAPAMARFKIFIIDEVHMLTKEAFNALLKTLEEPPPYVKFILATTDPLKLPATILSRTQHFRFKKIPHRLVVAHLKMILQKEEVGYDDGALEIIARSGGGSLRDTLTLTDQAINYCDKFLTTQQVTQMLGVVDPQVLSDFFGSILHNDEEGLKRNLETLSEYECEMIIDEMLLFLKDALFGGNKDFPLLLLDRFLGILSRAKSLLNLNPDGGFVLTLISLKMREAMKLKDINEAINSLEKAGVLSKNLAQNPIQNNAQNLSQNQPQNLAQDLSQESMPNKEHNTQNPPNTTNTTNDNTQDSSTQPTPNPSQMPLTPTNATNQNLASDLDNAKFDELVKKIYDRSFELGEVFSACVEFECVKENVLYWKACPNESQKGQLTRGYAVIVALAKEIFGETIAIKNTAKDSKNDTNPSNPSNPTNQPPSQNLNQSQNQNMAESKAEPNNAIESSITESIIQTNMQENPQNNTQEYTQNNTQESNPQHIDSANVDSSNADFGDFDQSKSMESNEPNATHTTNATESNEANKAQSNDNDLAKSQLQTQQFIAQNKELIDSIKQNFGATQMRVQDDNKPQTT